MKSPAHDYPPLIASINVRGAEKAIEFYAEAFGATERYRLTNTGSGKHRPQSYSVTLQSWRMDG